MRNRQTKKDSLWATTPIANLVRYVPSGKYFARLRVGGKLIRQSLKTQVMSVARLRLGDLIKEERGKLESITALVEGKMTIEDAIDLYSQRIQSDTSLKPNAKRYRVLCNSS